MSIQTGLTFQDVADLRERGFPELPSYVEMIDRCGKRSFLLVELRAFEVKSNALPDYTNEYGQHIGLGVRRFRANFPDDVSVTLLSENDFLVSFASQMGAKRWKLTSIERDDLEQPTYPKGRAEDLGKKEAIEFLQSLLRRKWRDGAAQQHWIDERDVERVLIALGEDPAAYRRRLEEAGAEFPFPR